MTYDHAAGTTYTPVEGDVINIDGEQWEYGADFSKLSPMAGICTYPNSDDSGRAEAERVVKAARRTDKRVKLVRRRPAGPWLPVEGESKP